SNQVIEEITVTARKKVERLIDTPVAVAVLTAEEIDRYNTRDLVELTQRIPGLSIAHAAGGGAGGRLFIRGVGNIASDYGADQPVSLVMDGMSFSRGHVLDTGFFDIAAVEVLKGPQTLFFGKNSPAGVVSVTSISPEVGGEFEMFARASYEFVSEDPVIEAGFSVPVGEHWAFRFAGRRQDMQDGWLKNSAEPLDVTAFYPGFDFSTRGASDSDKFPNQDQTVLRMTAVWEPNDTFSANLKLFHSDSEQNEAGYTILYACADGPGANPYYTAFPDPTQICPDSKPKLERNSALPPAGIANAHPFIDEDSKYFNSLNQEIYTLEMTWEINDNWTLSSVSGYWDYFHREYTNYDYTSYAVVVSQQGESGDAFTQELRLQSNFDGPINFMVGGFYETMERDLDAPVQILPSLFFAPGVVPYVSGQFAGDEFYDGAFISYHQHWDNNIESFSVFGSFEWELAEQWTLAGGARYTKEDRDSVGGNILENSGFLGFSPSQIFYSPEDKADNISPELTLSWHPTDDVMVYGAFKTGFQSAGISNPGTVANLTSFTADEVSDILTFDETTVWGFEFGVKGYFFDGRLSANMAVFRYESEDLQVGIFNSNTTSFTLQNAAVALNTGVEVQGIFQVNENLQLRLAGQYNKLKFDKFEDSGCHPVDGSRADLATRSAPDCHIGPEGAAIQDLSGTDFGGPPLQINVGFTYDVSIMDGWGLVLDWDTIHHNKGKRVNGQPFTETPSRTVTHLRATAYQPGGPWELGLICSNCFNEIYVTGIGNKPLAKINPGVNGDMTAQIAPPRLVTLQLTYRM
ncbi:MAG: TonB-dependent receptor, partial [Pseudomonadales bacterium]